MKIRHFDNCRNVEMLFLPLLDSQFMAVKRVEVHYSGRVQGVGFRFTAERFASVYKVVGYVRNMPDGRVELVAEGEEETLKEFLDAIRQDMGYLITNYTINWFPATGEFDKFRIRFY